MDQFSQKIGRRMRKYSQITHQHKNINHLLAELASIELQSTELKITQLIQRQRTNYREARGIPTFLPLNNTHNRPKLSLNTYHDKENHKYTPTHLSTVLVSPSQIGIQRSKTTISSRAHLSTERYFGRTDLQTKKKEKVELPALLGNEKKKSSLLCEAMDRILQRKREQSMNEDLPVIEEDALQGLRDTFFMAKLQKQRSWGPSSNQS